MEKTGKSAVFPGRASTAGIGKYGTGDHSRIGVYDNLTVVVLIHDRQDHFTSHLKIPLKCTEQYRVISYF